MAKGQTNHLPGAGIFLLVLIPVFIGCLQPDSILAQTRFLRDGHSGITATYQDHFSDSVEWYVEPVFTLEYTHRGRWDLGLQYGKQNQYSSYSATEYEIKGEGAFARYVLIVPGKPDGLGVELEGQYHVQRRENELPILPLYFYPEEGYHRFQRVFRGGARFWLQPTKAFSWGLGIFSRVRREQIRANDSDEVLLGKDLWELGFSLDIDILLARYFTLFLHQELSQDRTGNDGWVVESSAGLGLQFDLSGGK